MADKLTRSQLLSPDQRRKEHREQVRRKILERPEETAEEARRRGALRFFLRCCHEQEPGFLTELRDLLSGPPPISPFLGEKLRSLTDRYYLPPTIAVATECVSTLLMWQAFPDLPTDWHFKLPEGALADPLGMPKSARPFPVVFVAEGWNPRTETLDVAKDRLTREFKVVLNTHTFWAAAEIDHSELHLFEEESTSHERRNLAWLAAKQANPRLTYRQLANDHDCSEDTVQRGILEAAGQVELPSIRQAPRGRRRK